MRVPGLLLRTPILLERHTGNRGDGDTYAAAVQVMADVKTSVRVSNGPEGQTITTWATCTVRPTVTVTAGDRVTVHGVARKVASVAPIQGAGRTVAGLLLTAGDG